MRKEYKNQNIKQIINSRFFLKKFKNKVRKNNQMRIYSRQFKNISIKLIKWEQLNIYIQCSWYLQRLLNSYRIKLICKYNFNLFDSNIIIFELVYKTVINMIDIVTKWILLFLCYFCDSYTELVFHSKVSYILQLL